MSYSSDVAFTRAVKAVQERKGSRASYARLEEAGSWKTRITPDLKMFIEAQTSVFLATANAQGQPYIQRRANCPQHIPQRLEAADVATALTERDRRIVELEAQVALLRTAGEQ
jgi:hypothetical protein